MNDGKGFVKIHRELFQHPIWLNSTPEQKTILIALIGLVNHSPKKWEWKGETFEAGRGQKVTSLDEIKAACGKGISTQNVRTALARFEKLGFLTNESTKTGRLVTIVNYDKWQEDKSKANKETNKDLTKTSQRPNKDLTPNKNNKNEKNDKNIYKDVPDNIKDVFMEWVEMRDKMDKPILSETGVSRALEKLYSLSHDPDKQRELIGYAIYKNWLSFYPIPQEDKIPKQKEEEQEEVINAVPMPEEVRRKMNALGYGIER